MRILICNDDGIDAPGIALLEKVAKTLSDDVWIVAPDAKRTAASSSLTVAKPIYLTELRPNTYSCSGTPADCVVVAMTWLFKNDRKPDLVLAGVNDGKNVAEDIAYSGTLGIAREATFWGVPAIGLSREKNAVHSDDDAAHISTLIDALWKNRSDWELENHWLSVNLPKVLPASIAQPTNIGRDKIATQAEIVSSASGRTELVIPRGRDNETTAGDENELLIQGCCTINRLTWTGQTPLEDQLLGVLAGQ